MIPFILVLLVLGMSDGKRGSNKLPPPPKPNRDKLRAYVCELMQEGVLTAAMLPLLVRRLYPAGSWPVAEEWTSGDVGALPPPERAKYDAARKEFDEASRDRDFLATCTDAMSPYAEGGVTIRDGDYVATWRYDHRIDDPGGSLHFDDLDSARTAVLKGVWYFGAPAAPTDTFAEGWIAPESGTRQAVWEMAGGGYRVVVLIGDSYVTSEQVASLEDARAQRSQL